MKKGFLLLGLATIVIGCLSAQTVGNSKRNILERMVDMDIITAEENLGEGISYMSWLDSKRQIEETYYFDNDICYKKIIWLPYNRFNDAVKNYRGRQECIELAHTKVKFIWKLNDNSEIVYVDPMLLTKTHFPVVIEPMSSGRIDNIDFALNLPLSEQKGTHYFFEGILSEEDDCQAQLDIAKAEGRERKLIALDIPYHVWEVKPELTTYSDQNGTLELEVLITNDGSISSIEVLDGGSIDDDALISDVISTIMTGKFYANSALKYPQTGTLSLDFGALIAR